MNDQPSPDLGETVPDPPRGFMGRVRNYFLTGLVVAGPVAITFYLTWWFVNWVDGFVRPLVPPDYRPETYLPFAIPGSGLVVAFVALTLLGFLTANLIGRTLVDLGERLLGRMPVVRAIYRGLKQVFETLFAGNGSSLRKVGLVEFPSPGMWSIVLISLPPNKEVASRIPSPDEHIAVFLPCAPNPTTGFFFYVPKSKVISVDMSAEEAATLIMSAGVVQPGSDPQKKIAALAATALAAKKASGEPESAFARRRIKAPDKVE
ncbi:Protein of unknown function DUF502 [Rhodopseudomonas palustris HaA2]|uniref:DUF502 domain-containing protein n=1 Tax=Rhodopseudomonas palustris (strain HaA2) TaxID=316058 RepID=Q2IW55_RHOP2|nr:DUF502 domain-containing protein [Rhodopseudomonas palustris]ABD07555.1 Protein of unknown function DUF502 [Rhodopseudomonas palustris HaA2]